MQELIDRQAALKKMCETCGYCERSEKAMRSTHPDFVAGKCNNYRFLAELPTVEPEVRHAYWEPSEVGEYHCTHCGAECDIDQFHKALLNPFCGKCGAKMDGDEEDA